MIKRLWNLVKTDGLMRAVIISGIPYSYGISTITLEINQTLNPRVMAFMAMVNAVGIVLINNFWRDKKLTKYFKLLLILESTVFLATAIFYIITKNNTVFYIIDILSTLIISNSIQCNLDIIKETKYEGGRNKADKDFRSLGAVSTFIGSLLATLVSPSIEIALGMFYVATISDNYYQWKEYEKFYNKAINN